MTSACHSCGHMAWSSFIALELANNSSHKIFSQRFANVCICPHGLQFELADHHRNNYFVIYSKIIIDNRGQNLVLKYTWRQLILFGESMAGHQLIAWIHSLTDKSKYNLGLISINCFACSISLLIFLYHQRRPIAKPCRKTYWQLLVVLTNVLIQFHRLCGAETKSFCPGNGTTYRLCR